MTDDRDLAARLEELTQALQALASTQRTDSARAIAARREAVRAAGEAFEMELVPRCVSYSALFDGDDEDDWEEEDGEEDEDDVGSFRISIDDEAIEDWDYEDLPDGTRMSVLVQEDFVLVDEEAFRASAMQVFEETGPWPPDVEPTDDSIRYLMALVDAVGLPAVVFGDRLAGLEAVGGRTQVLVVDGPPGQNGGMSGGV